jgi:serine/threonine protein phosphatase 1
MGKLFAIGDIHGCLSKLQNLMGMIEVNPQNDTIIFVGDYIDRGSDSKGVIDLVIDLRQRFKNVICLMGNHEKMLINYHFEGIDEEIFFLNGGHITAFSYGLVRTPKGVRMNIPEAHLEFYKSLRMFYETDRHIFVHAGLRPGVPLAKQNSHDMLWIRNEFIRTKHDFGKIVVYGHTPVPHPMVDETKIGIDTGAVYGGMLTCIELTEMNIFQC